MAQGKGKGSMFKNLEQKNVGYRAMKLVEEPVRVVQVEPEPVILPVKWYVRLKNWINEYLKLWLKVKV